jgi:hypothetical protein
VRFAPSACMNAEDANPRSVDQIDALIRNAERLRAQVDRQLRQRPFWPDRRRSTPFSATDNRAGGASGRRADDFTHTPERDGGAGHVPYDRLALRVPARCRFCGTAGRTKPEQTIKGTSVLLTWYCEACNEEWPITLAERKEERRRGSPDTRQRPKERRRKT